MSIERGHSQLDRAEGGNDGYFASVSDLMFGLLFIFIILLVAFGLYYQAAQAQIGNLNDYIDGLTKAYSDILAERYRTREELLKWIQQELAKHGIGNVAVDFDEEILRLPEHLLFPTAQATLLPEGRDALRTLAGILMDILPCYQHDTGTRPASCPPRAKPALVGIYIEGHADNRPLRCDPSQGSRCRTNWDLSAMCAVETFTAMVDSRAGLRTLRNVDDKELFGVSGYGEERPVASNDTESGRQQNRRIDLRFLLATPSVDDIGNQLQPPSAAQ